MTHSPPEAERPVLNATRARQGRPGRPVFWVLLFGTLLAALAMFAAWTWKAGEEPVPVGRGQETVSGKGFGAPEPPPANPDPS